MKVAFLRSSLLSPLANSGSKTALYPFAFPGDRCIGVRSLREWFASEEGMAGADCVPFGADISAEECAARGLKGFEGEDSEWVVSGVKPFAARFCAPACEP